MASSSATTNVKQLTENLASYEAQLDQVIVYGLPYTIRAFQVCVCVIQVEAALTNDPDNEELLKLKNDLLVIDSEKCMTVTDNSVCVGCEEVDP